MDVLQLNTSTGRVQQVALTSLPASSIETEVWNNSGATILKGSVIYISGAHGNLPTIELSDASTELGSSKTYGFVEADIGNNDNGFVIASGLISNLDTFGVTEGLTLWLSPTVPGGYTTTKPTAPNHAVSLGTCTRAHPTQGTINVRVQNGYELGELHNVAINGTLVDKDIIRYDSATSLWKNNPSLTTLETTVANMKDVAITFYALPMQTGHAHNTYLTAQEAIDLMSGTVASVIRNSSSNGSTPHVHSVTITWDTVNYKFDAVTATALAHVHDAIGNSPNGGWQILGKTQLAVGANATSIITIPPRTLLRITCIVTGYSGNGIASLRFGTVAGAVDTGNNYNTRYLRAAAGANNNFTDVPNTSTNFLRLASQNSVLGRQYTVNVTNYATKRKMCSVSTSSEAGAVGTAPTLDWGQGMYGNNTAQIITAQLISTANNLSIGSGFIVEGINL